MTLRAKRDADPDLVPALLDEICDDAEINRSQRLFSKLLIGDVLCDVS
jgi:hypothetical protein